MSTYTGVIAACQKPCNCGATRLTDLYIEQDIYYLTSQPYPLEVLEELSSDHEVVEMRLELKSAYLNPDLETTHTFPKWEMFVAVLYSDYVNHPKMELVSNVTFPKWEKQSTVIYTTYGNNPPILLKNDYQFPSWIREKVVGYLDYTLEPEAVNTTHTFPSWVKGAP